ncbi:MAG: hypothetical protein LBU34_04000 [Planctomycetaceae bacterium]|nr:hypothetical protein [Planctomycetaceae bacterium]
MERSATYGSESHKVGNQNNQHDINSLSANADATLRRRVTYLLIFKTLFLLCHNVGCFGMVKIMLTNGTKFVIKLFISLLIK